MDYMWVYDEVDFHVQCILSLSLLRNVLNITHDYLLKNETALRMCLFYFHKICYVSILTIFLNTLSIPV